MLERERDIFPLPKLAVETLPLRGQLCRTVERRILRRSHVQKQVNLAVDALNSMYFGHERYVVPMPVRAVKELNHQSQRDTLEHLISRVHAAGAPPMHLSHSGAINALRVASSPYGDALSGVGEVVPMNLELLSIPEVGVDGVPIQDLLEGSAGDFIRDPENFMLQDASNWGVVSDEVASIKTYNDPQLRNKKFYLRYLQKLHQSGILSWCVRPRGRVGSFVVRKKPKEVNGKMVERQRLILDCRRVNTMFRAPPSTELGSLSAVCDLSIPPGGELHLAGADIKDCFYACRLPYSLREYFGFSYDISISEAESIFGGQFAGVNGIEKDSPITPCLDVLPMGYSWSFYLVQQLHVQACIQSSGQPAENIILESRPPPSLTSNNTLAMPYCDNTHVMGLDPSAVEDHHHQLKGKLQDWGFDMHEELGPTTVFPTLGGVIDGSQGLVTPNKDRYWNLFRAFQFVLHRPVSSEMIQRLLGHGIVVMVLNRSGMNIFRSLYDFAARNFRRIRLWKSACRECRIFLGVLPLLVGDLRRAWSPTIQCSDASPDGYGICERDLPLEKVSEQGLWQERWRFKRLPPDEWCPRDRALRRDPLADVDTARAFPGAVEQTDLFVRNESFKEIDREILRPEEWRVAKTGKWQHTHEHITLKEGRVLTLLARRLSRARKFRNKKVLVLVDNLALAFSIGKGRSCNHDMLRVVQKIGALSLACNFILRVRWIPSELNISDGPSRGSHSPGYFNPAFNKEKFQSSAFSQKDRGSEPCDSKRIEKWQRVHEGEGSKDGQEEGGEGEEKCGGLQGSDRPAEEVETWNQSSWWEHVHARDEQRQRRAEEPVQLLPAEVQRLVQGERLVLAPQEGSRRNLGRLFRCPLLGRKVFPRRREDSGCDGIPLPLPEEQAPKIKEGIAGVEEVGSTEESHTAPQSSRLWHSYEDDGSGSLQYGFDGDLDIRCLSPPGGSSRSPWQEHRGTNSKGGEAVSLLHADCEGSRRRESRQDRDIQQLHCAGQSRQRSMVGKSPVQDQTQAGQPGSFVQLQDGDLPSRVPTSRLLAGIGRAARLSNEAWRSLRRFGQQTARPQCSEGSRKVADRCVSPKVCKDWEGSESASKASSLGSGLLQSVHETDGQGCGRSCCPIQPLSPLWQHWHDPPGPCILEIFAGCGRLTSELRRRGFLAFAIDTCLNPNDDLLDGAVEQRIFKLIIERRVLLIWLGMPCTTFSIARRDDGLGPGPLRSDSSPMGLPNLKAADRKKLEIGNRLLFVTIRIIVACLMVKIPFVLENPHSSRCWITPLLQRLLGLQVCQYIHLDFFCFKESWKKPTGLLHAFVNLQSLARTCKGTRNICSESGKRHIALKGRAPDGRFRTLIAQPYPQALVEELTSLFAVQL